MTRLELAAVILVGLVLAWAVSQGVSEGREALRPSIAERPGDPHGLARAGRAARQGIDPLRPPGLPPGVTIDPTTGFLAGLGLEPREGEEVLTWHLLQPLNKVREAADVPEDLRALDGERVVMAGFLMPLYKLRDIRSFAFVGSHFTCCFERMPGLGDQVVVTLGDGAPSMQLTVKPIRVRGILRLKPKHWFESGKGPLLSVFEIEDAEAAFLQ